MAVRAPVSSAIATHVLRAPGSVRGYPRPSTISRVSSSKYSRWIRAQSSSSEATPPEPRKGYWSRVLATPEHQSFVFSFLAVVYTGIASATTLAPVWSLQNLMQVSRTIVGATQADSMFVALSAAKGMLVVAGAYGWLMAACCVCLKDAAVHQRLNSGTYKRLLLGVMYQGIIATVLFIKNDALFPAGRPSVYPIGIFACTALVAGRVYAVTEGKFSLPTIAKGCLGNIREVFKPQTPISVFYAAAALLALLMFFWQFPTPGTPLFQVDCGPMAVFLKQARGAGMVIAGVVWYTLKDAAERGRLGASTFKQLNLAMAVVAALQLWGYWQISNDAVVPLNPKLWNMLIGSGLLTLAVCDYQFFFAKK